MYIKESGFGLKIHRTLKGLRLRLVVLTISVFLSQHISLNKMNNNHFEEIKDSFAKYFENRKQINLKLVYFPIFFFLCFSFFFFFFFLPKTSNTGYL